MSADEAEVTPSREPADLTLTTLGQVMALFVILVPICGYIGYFFYFLLSPRLFFYESLDLAVERSLPSLSVVGGVIIFLSLFTVFLEHFGAPSKVASGARRAMQRKVRIGLFAFLLVIFLFASAYLAIALVIYIPLFRWSYERWRIGSAISFRNLWRPIMALILGSSLIVALFLITYDTGYVVFSRASGIQNGYYTLVGSNADQELLLPCNRQRGLVSADDQAILSVMYRHVGGPSFSQGLIEIIANEDLPPLEAGSISCPSK
jgi:hypothetical protein